MFSNSIAMYSVITFVYKSKPRHILFYYWKEKCCIFSLSNEVFTYLSL